MARLEGVHCTSFLTDLHCAFSSVHGGVEVTDGEAIVLAQDIQQFNFDGTAETKGWLKPVCPVSSVEGGGNIGEDTDI